MDIDDPLAPPAPRHTEPIAEGVFDSSFQPYRSALWGMFGYQPGTLESRYAEGCAAGIAMFLYAQAHDGVWLEGAAEIEAFVDQMHRDKDIVLAEIGTAALELIGPDAEMAAAIAELKARAERK